MKCAAVLFVNGQSNAHAHEQFLKEVDRITIPMKNVFSLDRDPNQSFEIQDVVWSGYTTQGKNLGETQDHTCSFAYCVAKLWQKAIDDGATLPDLYIVQISVGSQGIINGMWNPDKEKILKPGPLGTVDISLFTLALQIDRLAMENLKRNGMEPVVIGRHWIGSEQDIRVRAYARDDLHDRYDYFFDAILSSPGKSCPLYLYKLYTKKVGVKNGIPECATDAINEALFRQCERHRDVTVIEAENCPLWNPEDEHDGIFAQDGAHYRAEVQRWFAETFFEKVNRTFTWKEGKIRYSFQKEIE